MKEQRCGLCRFWSRYPFAIANNLESGESGGDRRSSCRRYAPALRDAGLPAAWPQTDKSDWCGEFEPWVPVEAQI